MAEALGPGKIVGGLAIARPYARIYVQVQPLLFDASGAPLPNPGTFDANGQYLHVRYRGNLKLGGRSGGNQDPSAIDFVPNLIQVEFDAQSEMTLPFEGEIQLVGGRGQWKWGLEVLDYTDPRDYRPEFRWLSTNVLSGAMFTIPDFHTYIMAADPTKAILTPTIAGYGNIVAGSVIPGQSVTAGTQWTNGGANVVYKTAWRG